MASRRIRRTKSIAGYLDSLNQEGLESRLRNNTQSVAADSITSGALSEEVQIVDKAIQSINYAPGADGWRIDGGGNAEFGNVFVRGDINAETGTIGYWNISRPVVERTFGTRTYSGTFLESSDIGPTDEDTATKGYVSLFKSYFDDPTNFTAFQLDSNKVTLTLTAHSFFVGDPIVVQFDDSAWDDLESTEISVVYVSETTPNTVSYLLPTKETSSTIDYASLTSNIVTLVTIENHNFAPGDEITVSNLGVPYDGTYTANTASGTVITYDRVYASADNAYAGVVYKNSAYNETGTADEALTEAAGTVQIYFKDVAGLYLRDYSKSLLDYGYFSNEGVKYVSAQSYNLVHNPSFEYLVSGVPTYSNTGWTVGVGANLTLSSFENSSTVTIDSVDYELFRDDSVYTSYSGKVTWGATQNDNYASVVVDYGLFKQMSDLNKIIYFDFYAYFNPAGAELTVTQIQRILGSNSVVVTTSTPHGLGIGEYVWNEFVPTDPADNEDVNLDAYVPLRITAKTDDTFTVTILNPASGNVTATGGALAKDNIFRFHPGAYKLTDIKFELPNSSVISLYEVLTDDTRVLWDANVAYRYFSLPYARNSVNGFALSSHGVDDNGDLAIYNLPRLGPISSEGTLVPYEIKIDSSKFSNLYNIRDAANAASEVNVKILFPGWIYRNEATISSKIFAYATTGIYLDNITLSTEKSFFYGDSGIASQTWYDSTSAPNTASVLAAKTWIDIDLENQTSYLNHTDYISFKSPLLRDKLLKNSGIYTVDDVDNTEYKPINIGTSLVSDYSSLLFTSGEYEYELGDGTYANYESLISSRVEKDKAFLYLSTLYKNLDADGTFSSTYPNKWQAGIKMATAADTPSKTIVLANSTTGNTTIIVDSTDEIFVDQPFISENTAAIANATVSSIVNATAFITSGSVGGNSTNTPLVFTTYPQKTEINIIGSQVSVSHPVTGTDTYFVVNGDQDISGNLSVTGNVALAGSVSGDLIVDGAVYVGTNLLELSEDVDTTDFARRARTNTVTDLPTGTWYTIAYNPGGSNLVSIGRATAQFVLVDRQAGKHQSVHFMASATFGDPALTILHSSAFSANAPFEAIRVKTGSTYDGAALQVYSNGSSSVVNVQAFMYANDQTVGAWELVDFIDDAEDPSTYGTVAMSNYANLVAKSELNLELGGGLLENKMMVDGSIVAANSANSAIYTIIQPSSSTFFGNVSIGNNLTINGNLTVNGTTTTINSTTLSVDDKNIVLGNNASSTNTTASGGGITVEAITGGDKTWTWENSTGAWTSNQDINVASGKVYEINGTTVLSSSQVLGYSISSTNVANTIVLRDASGNFTAGLIGAQTAINMGKTDGTITTPFIDFNTGATAVDYDARILASGGSGTTGQGNVVIYAGTTQVYGGLAASPTFTVRGATSQTGPLQVWENSGGTDQAYINKDGRLSILAGSTDILTTIPATIAVNPYTTGAVGIAVRGVSGQTGDLQRWMDSSDTTLASIDAQGDFTANTVTSNLATSFGYPVANVANLGTNVATFLTTPSSANLRNAVTDEAGTGSLVFRGSTTAATTDIAVGWYTIAYIPANRGSAKFVVTDTRAGRHQVVAFHATALFDLDTATGITVLHQSAYSLANAPIQKIRIKSGNVSTDGAVLQIYVDNATNSLAAYVYENDIPSTWTIPTNWVADASDPGVGVYANLTAATEVNLDSGGAGRNQMLVTGDVYAGVNATSHVLASQAYSIAANTNYTLATNNTNQSAFPALANGAPLESGFRYEFEGVLVLNHSVTRVTGTVTDTLYVNFNTPSLTYGWVEYNYTTSTTATFTAGASDTVTSDVVTTSLGTDAVANVASSSSGTVTRYVYVRFRGSLKTSASGNLLPQVKFNLNTTAGDGSNAGAIQAGSWMRVTKVAETTTGWT